MAKVSPMGYRLYWVFLEESDEKPAAQMLSAAVDHLENEWIRAEFNPASGALTALIVKATGENVLSAPTAARLMDISYCDTWAHMEFTCRTLTNLRTKSIKTRCGSSDVSGNTVAQQSRLFFAQSRQDQQTMGLGFGGRDANTAAATATGEGHGHTMPPSFSQQANSSAGIGSTRQ